MWHLFLKTIWHLHKFWMNEYHSILIAPSYSSRFSKYLAIHYNHFQPFIACVTQISFTEFFFPAAAAAAFAVIHSSPLTFPMCKQPLIVHYHAKTKQKFLVFCWLPWDVFSWLSSDFDVCQCKTKGWFSDRTARERKKAFPNFTIENQLFILYTIFTVFFFVSWMDVCKKKSNR